MYQFIIYIKKRFIYLLIISMRKFLIINLLQKVSAKYVKLRIWVLWIIVWERIMKINRLFLLSKSITK